MIAQPENELCHLAAFHRLESKQREGCLSPQEARLLEGLQRRFEPDGAVRLPSKSRAAFRVGGVVGRAYVQALSQRTAVIVPLRQVLLGDYLELSLRDLGSRWRFSGTVIAMDHRNGIATIALERSLGRNGVSWERAVARVECGRRPKPEEPVAHGEASP